MSDRPEALPGWRSFWSKGGLSRAVLAALGYLALYLAASLLMGAIFGDRVDADNIFSTPQSVFFGLVAPLVVGAALLIAFVLSLGWSPRLFARQQVPRRGWMWLAPVFVVAAIVLRFLGIDYGSYAAGVVAVTFVAGALIGFVEETLTRGIVVTMLRESGRSEWAVMVVSSLIFGVLHATNILSGQSLAVVLGTVVFAFAFGVCMYLSMRVTGRLIWPILLHALYDPTLFLATGGIDEAHSGAQNPLLTLAGPANLIFVLVSIVALIAVRGRSERSADDLQPLQGSSGPVQPA